MEIIDCQIHAPHDIPSLLPGQRAELQNIVAVRTAVAALDAVGVDGAIANWTPAFNQALFEAHPDRFRTVTAFEPQGARAMNIVLASLPDFPKDLILAYEDAEHLADLVADLTARTGMVSMRLEPGMLLSEEWRHNAKLFAEGAYDAAFSLAAELDMPVCLLIAGALEHVSRVADEFSRTILVIDHLGLLPFNFPIADPESEVPLLLGLARFPNVVVKMSGMISWSNEPYPFRDLWPLVRSVFDAFGPERVMWGSDFTIHQPRRNYADALHFLLYTDLLSDLEKKLFFAENLRRIFRWDRSDSSAAADVGSSTRS
jgi:predicted TIM-barrel fold metal-dependent hydrolase